MLFQFHAVSPRLPLAIGIALFFVMPGELVMSQEGAAQQTVFGLDLTEYGQPVEWELIETDAFSWSDDALVEGWGVGNGEVHQWRSTMQFLAADRNDALSLTLAPSDVFEVQTDTHLGVQFALQQRSDQEGQNLVSWSGWYLSGSGEGRARSSTLRYEAESTLWSLGVSTGTQIRRVGTDVQTTMGLRYVNLTDEYDEYFGAHLGTNDFVAVSNSVLLCQVAIGYLWQRETLRMRTTLQGGLGPNWRSQEGEGIPVPGRFDEQSVAISTYLLGQAGLEYSVTDRTFLGAGLSGWFLGNIASARDAFGAAGEGDQARWMGIQIFASRDF